MFKKRYVAAAACALAMVGTASAVQVSREGTGDLLIAPAYFIGGGMTTDLKVVNTSATQSVVAKVVFRDQVTSAEVLDFLIYLSPSDVWTGTVSCEGWDAVGVCNKSQVFSDDDSILQASGVLKFASKAEPFRIVSDSAEVAATGRLALGNQGYVEVVMGAAYDVTNAANRLAPGVDKMKIYNQHLAAPTFVGANQTPNVLMGTVTAKMGGASATIPMVALADYDNNEKVAVNVLSGLDVRGQRTSVADVEEALWTNNIAVPYSVGAGKASLVTFTFPTKLTYAAPNALIRQYPFGAKTCVTSELFDHSENTMVPTISPAGQGCLNEFQWLTFGPNRSDNINTGAFTEGWARFNFTGARPAASQVLNPAQNTNLNRLGVPAIATFMTVEPGKITWAYASSTRP